MNCAPIPGLPVVGFFACRDRAQVASDRLAFQPRKSGEMNLRCGGPLQVCFGAAAGGIGLNSRVPLFRIFKSITACILRAFVRKARIARILVRQPENPSRFNDVHGRDRPSRDGAAGVPRHGTAAAGRTARNPG
jgi:hypothetical protein